MRLSQAFYRFFAASFITSITVLFMRIDRKVYETIERPDTDEAYFSHFSHSRSI